jgi:hypothetical protein
MKERPAFSGAIYNQRGTAGQWIKEGRHTLKYTVVVPLIPSKHGAS